MNGAAGRVPAQPAENAMISGFGVPGEAA